MSIKSIIIDKETKATRIDTNKVQLELTAFPMDEENDTEPNSELQLYVNSRFVQTIKSDNEGKIKEILIINDKESEEMLVKVKDIVQGVQSKIKCIMVEDNKEKNKTQFKKNSGKEDKYTESLPDAGDIDIQQGKEYTGIITGSKESGTFIQISTGKNPHTGLLHKSKAGNRIFEKGATIKVIIDFITPDKKINFKLPEIAHDSIEVGQIFEAQVMNVNKDNLVFVKIKESKITGILKTNLPKRMIADSFTKGEKMKVVLIRKDEKGLFFEGIL